MKYFLSVLCCFFLVKGVAQENYLPDFLSRKQYAKVIAYADSLSVTDSASYQTMYVIGQAYEGMLKYRDAYKYYQHCLTFDTLNVEILNTLGRTATNLGRATDAQQYFNKVLQNDSTDFYANYQIARLYQQLGEYEKAIDKYMVLLQQDEENVIILRNLGDCYMRLEMSEDAISYYLFAYNYNRENAGLASTLVNAMYRLDGDLIPQALAICDTALYYNPDNVTLKRNKGMGLFMMKEYALANNMYTSLMEEGDSTLLTMKYGGASRYYAGLYMDAIEPLERAFTMDSTSVDATILYGSVLGRTYDRKRAYQLFDHADLLMQPNELYYNLLLQSRAETLSRDGRLYEASNLFYDLWKRTERLDALSKAALYRLTTKVSDYKTPTERQRGLYLQIAYLREYVQQERDVELLPQNYRYLLESLYEDMFFQSTSEEALLSPDGKRSTINLVDLWSMISLLPEISDDTRREWREIQEHHRNTRSASPDSLAGKRNNP